jgi:iron(III) transport system ATP-binding protein
MTNEPSTAAIEVLDLVKRFGPVTAVDRVSLAVAPGELFFLLGPSGCGKTTLLRILAGLETPDSGSIRFAGRDVSGLEPHRRGAPMVFQSYALWPHLSVRENVAFGLVERRVPKAETRQRVDDVLAKVGLAGMGERRPGQLSGGQQQRVVLARALVLNPNVILLDEPLSNLDAKLRHDMREEIRRLHAESNITFLYVTHDQAEALSLADRIGVMEAGRIRALGRPRDLYHRPPDRFCADFLGEANFIEATVRSAQAGRVELQTPFGVWQGVAGDGEAPRAGAAVTVVVRPESLEPLPPGGAAEAALPGNRVSARVERLQMNGSTLTAFLRVAGDGRPLKAVLLNRYAPAVREAETAVWRVAAEQTVVVG